MRVIISIGYPILIIQALVVVFLTKVLLQVFVSVIGATRFRNVQQWVLNHIEYVKSYFRDPFLGSPLIRVP